MSACVYANTLHQLQGPVKQSGRADRLKLEAQLLKVCLEEMLCLSFQGDVQSNRRAAERETEPHEAARSPQVAYEGLKPDPQGTQTPSLTPTPSLFPER